MKYQSLESKSDNVSALLVISEKQQLIEELIALPSNPTWSREGGELVATFYLNDRESAVRRAAVLMLEYTLRRYERISNLLLEMVRFMHVQDESDDVRYAADDLLDVVEVYKVRH